MSRLRHVRIAVSTLSCLLVTVLFLDVTHRIPPSWSSVILAFQFAPAVMDTISAAGIALAGLIVISLGTLLYGRIYCSHLCPLGALQDVIIWLQKKKYRRRSYPYQKTNYWILYLVTAAVVVTAVAGSALLLDLLEPYSNFGRILVSLVRPLIILANNAAAYLLGSSNIFGLTLLPLHGIEVWTIAVPLLFFGVIIALTVWRGRLFCNTLCPVGGILSLLSRFSLYKITIQKHECIDCGLCERVCRAQCIDSETKQIDTAACVGCFDCIGSCPTDGMGYQYRRTKNPVAELEPERRAVLFSITAAVISSAGLRNIAEPLLPPPSGYDLAKTQPVVPPGGISQKHFSSYCTACHLCVSACPTNVLQPSFLEYGAAGILQPKMDYNISYCNYDCTICSDVCPTGAIQQLAQKEKKEVQLGKVTFVKEDCIVEINKKDCGACDEHCPTKAVKMVPYGKLQIPQIENEYCVGCGACEHACPTTPRKAIYVTPNAVHLTAKKREEKPLEKQQAVPEEFPF